jgi:hypothetical protein
VQARRPGRLRRAHLSFLVPSERVGHAG